MRYDHECERCGRVAGIQSAPFRPPLAPTCCGFVMRRVFGCEFNTSNCKDADDVPLKSRVTQATSYGHSKAAGARKEAAYARHIAERRKMLKDGGNRGAIRHTHSIPAELYHGKVKETGDVNYWRDETNLARHRSCKVG